MTSIQAKGTAKKHLFVSKGENGEVLADFYYDDAAQTWRFKGNADEAAQQFVDCVLAKINESSLILPSQAKVESEL